MSRGLDRSLRAPLLTTAATVAAVAAGWAAHPWLGDGIVVVVLPAAVAAAVWLGGIRPALASAIAGFLVSDLLFIGAPGSFGPYDTAMVVELAGYVVVCAIVIGLGEGLWRARVRERHHRGVDVAERRRAEEARASLAAIVEASDDAIISKSLDGTIRSWNAGAERLFGYSAEEAVGGSINLIIPPERRDEEQTILARLRRGERVKHFETVRVTREGRRLDVSLSISPVRNDSGTIVGASKIARDITDQKRAEAALRYSEERFRELANNIDQFAWTWDRDGYATWYNQRWYEFSGATIEEMRGDGWMRFHDPAHLDRVIAGTREAVVTGEPWEDTFPLRDRDGAYRWFLSRAVPIRDGRGEVVRWFGTNTDITEQMKLEQALKAADRRKDEFLATLAHELRNPLAPIRNALEVLNRAGDDRELLERSRGIIDRQMNHMVRLVDDLLDVSRITRDRLDLRKAAVEVNDVVEQTVEMQRPLFDEHGVLLEVTPAAQPVHMLADPVRLAQILGNLLSNAARYTPAGGTVSVEVQRQGRQVLLSVRDTGVGIPHDKLDSIFEMFTQADGRHNGFGGLGIGLTLARRLAELHGGSIEVRSEGPARGSEFTLRLPVELPSAEHYDGGISTAPAADPRRVLVVEDNPDTADTLATLLRMTGHEARTAHDGPEALQLAESFRPEVVLLDLGLPRMNGIEVCRWIREQPWGRSVVVAALTGWGQDADRRRTREAGFDEHLVKPVGPDSVLRLLARPLVRRQPGA